MLKKILTEAAHFHAFSLVEECDCSIFFSRKDGRAERYLILREIEEVSSPIKINDETIQLLPDLLKQEPSFHKNCDLVLIHKLKKIADFKKVEDTALAIEEDPNYFKKYFLYYDEAEELAITEKGFKDFQAIIIDKDSFKNYKKNPLDPNFYSIVARAFIKLPFLDVPRSKKDLETLENTVSARLAEKNLTSDYNKIVSSFALGDSEKIAQELINEELENIKAKDSGI
ncbi:ABC-three component system middle component 1 [Duganella sp. LjRoot269]|uniref:ABC-three component system middle component 1 n=1 Tax=Duganella sp. LjRoot269 TaxID=3342305 RepID=UPI003ECC664E